MADKMTITLGPCHYDIDEVAVAVAVHKTGEGWIPVCDDHKKQAEDDGYEIRPDVDEEDRATSSKDKSSKDKSSNDKSKDDSDDDQPADKAESKDKDTDDEAADDGE